MAKTQREAGAGASCFAEHGGGGGAGSDNHGGVGEASSHFGVPPARVAFWWESWGSAVPAQRPRARAPSQGVDALGTQPVAGHPEGPAWRRARKHARMPECCFLPAVTPPSPLGTDPSLKGTKAAVPTPTPRGPPRRCRQGRDAQHGATPAPCPPRRSQGPPPSPHITAIIATAGVTSIIAPVIIVICIAAVVF